MLSGKIWIKNSLIKQNEEDSSSAEGGGTQSLAAKHSASSWTLSWGHAQEPSRCHFCRPWTFPSRRKRGDYNWRLTSLDENAERSSSGAFLEHTTHPSVVNQLEQPNSRSAVGTLRNNTVWKCKCSFRANPCELNVAEPGHLPALS